MLGRTLTLSTTSLLHSFINLRALHLSGFHHVITPETSMKVREFGEACQYIRQNQDAIVHTYRPQLYKSETLLESHSTMLFPGSTSHLLASRDQTPRMGRSRGELRQNESSRIEKRPGSPTRVSSGC